MSDPFAIMVAAVYQSLGRDAEYEGEDEAMCRVIVTHDLTQWGDTIQVQNNMAMISVQKSQIEEKPRRGDIFRLATGQEFNVERVMRSDEYEHRILVVSNDD